MLKISNETKELIGKDLINKMEKIIETKTINLKPNDIEIKIQYAKITVISNIQKMNKTQGLNSFCFEHMNKKTLNELRSLQNETIIDYNKFLAKNLNRGL